MRLNLFGGFSFVDSDGSAVRLSTRHAAFLIAYLARAGDRWPTRDEICDLLWPAIKGDPRHNLRQAMSATRRAVGAEHDGVIEVDRSRIRLRPDSVLVDVDAFEELCAKPSSRPKLKALGLYIGPFCDRLEDRIAEPGAAWIVEERQRLEEHAVWLAKDILKSAVDMADWTIARDVAWRLAAIDPFSEPAVRALALADLADGDAKSAQNRLARLVRSLRSDLDVAPSEETAALLQRLSDNGPPPRLSAEIGGDLGESAARSDDGGEPERPSTASAALVDAGDPSQRMRGRFVGRDREFNFILALQFALSTGVCGAVVKIVGEGGIGKSRLLSELERAIGAHAVNVAPAIVKLRHVRATELDLFHAFARSVSQIVAARSARTTIGVEPGLRASLSVFDAAASTERESVVTDPVDLAAQRAEERRALADLVARLVATQPLIVVVDDAHHLFADERAQLAEIAMLCVDHGAMILVATRPEGDPIDAAWRAQAVGAPIIALELTRLSAAAAYTLAQSLSMDDVVRAKRCAERSGGLPLLVEQLVADVGAADDLPPASANALLRQRLDQLSASDRRALAAIAVLGALATLSRLRLLLDDPVYNPNVLYERQWLSVDGPRLTFRHDLLRDAAYEAADETWRREAHRRAAAIVEKVDLAESAEHLARIHDPRSFDVFVEAAERALANGQPQRAATLASRLTAPQPSRRRRIGARKRRFCSVARRSRVAIGSKRRRISLARSAPRRSDAIGSTRFTDWRRAIA